MAGGGLSGGSKAVRGGIDLQLDFAGKAADSRSETSQCIWRADHYDSTCLSNYAPVVSPVHAS